MPSEGMRGDGHSREKGIGKRDRFRMADVQAEEAAAQHKGRYVVLRGKLVALSHVVLPRLRPFRQAANRS
jgi:hypothetical protein